MKPIFIILLMLIILCNLLNGVLFNKKNIIENLDTTEPVAPYQPYDNLANNPTFLSLQNSSNIAFLKSQMTDLIKLKDTVATLSSTVDLNSKGILQISNQISQAGQSVIGGPLPTTPLPQVSGL